MLEGITVHRHDMHAVRNDFYPYGNYTITTFLDILPRQYSFSLVNQRFKLANSTTYKGQQCPRTLTDPLRHNVKAPNYLRNVAKAQRDVHVDLNFASFALVSGRGTPEGCLCYSYHATRLEYLSFTRPCITLIHIREINYGNV